MSRCSDRPAAVCSRFPFALRSSVSAASNSRRWTARMALADSRITSLVSARACPRAWGWAPGLPAAGSDRRDDRLVGLLASSLRGLVGERPERDGAVAVIVIQFGMVAREPLLEVGLVLGGAGEEEGVALEDTAGYAAKRGAGRLAGAGPKLLVARADEVFLEPPACEERTVSGVERG